MDTQYLIDRLDENVAFSSPQDRQQAVLFAQACLVNGGTHPPLVITGPAGSGKSRLLATLATIVGSHIVFSDSDASKLRVSPPAFIDMARTIPAFSLVAVTMRDYVLSRMSVPSEAVIIKMRPCDPERFLRSDVSHNLGGRDHQDAAVRPVF